LTWRHRWGGEEKKKGDASHFFSRRKPSIGKKGGDALSSNREGKEKDLSLVQPEVPNEGQVNSKVYPDLPDTGRKGEKKENSPLSATTVLGRLIRGRRRTERW